MKIVTALEDLSAAGSTAGAAGIERAYDFAEEIVESDLKYQSENDVIDSKEWFTTNIRYKEASEDEKNQLEDIHYHRKDYFKYR